MSEHKERWNFSDGGFAQIFSQIASITVKNTNFISSRHVKRENTSLQVDVRRSKTSLLKLPILAGERDSRRHSVTDFSENVEVTEILKFSTVEGLTFQRKKKKRKHFW